ncbi:fatty acid oxygenase, partial [Apiospora sp. TS-2023a]
TYPRPFDPGSPATNQLPEPAQVFDTLLARGVAVRDNLSQISSLFLHFSALISIDRSASPRLNCLQQHTKYKGRRRLRLAPLYGRSSAEASTVRVFSNGLLKNDMFAFSEAWRMYPGVRTLLVMFNRFHNYTAGGLLAYVHPTTIKPFEIGSNCNRFPKSLTATERDEAVYQKARRITCRLYINIILNDYLRTFLGIHRTNTRWNLKPETLAQIFPSSDIEPSESGSHDSHKAAMGVIVDNWWKSAISEEDNN